MTAIKTCFNYTKLYIGNNHQTSICTEYGVWLSDVKALMEVTGSWTIYKNSAGVPLHWTLEIFFDKSFALIRMRLRNLAWCHLLGRHSATRQTETNRSTSFLPSFIRPTCISSHLLTEYSCQRHEYLPLQVSSITFHLWQQPQQHPLRAKCSFCGQSFRSAQTRSGTREQPSLSIAMRLMD